eukprot:2355103-Lingulodinium_polyedra.AAC.1
MATLGQEVRKQQHFLVAADWNLWPAQVEAVGFPAAVQGTLLVPPPQGPDDLRHRSGRLGHRLHGGVQ